jgi:branched-chain amino acid transport system substrate-binding protein
MRAALIGAVAVGASVVAAAFGQGDERARLPHVDPVDLPHCSPMMYRGEERPDVIVAASTSLQGRGAEYGVQGVQAMKLVLEERGWRAGQFRVGLQVCDETSATRGLMSPAKCWRNARAFARNRSVVGVVGPMHSECATEMLPSLNRAPGGSLVLVAPAATYAGLTRTEPGTAGADPGWYLPTGRRSFVRLLPADDVQGAAGAVFAKRGGAESVYVLNDCYCLYGSGVAAAFRRAATRIGLRVAGSGQWGAYASGYRALAERIRRTGADAVYLGGYLESNGVRLIRDLRSVLGPGVALLAPDGFASPAAIVEGAGPAAEGFTVTIAGLPKGELPATGRAFADRFEERYPSRPRTFSMHTAQAAHVLLDAIADSDASRAEVTERVLRTRVEDGLLGDFEFDRYGDTTLNAVAVYRIEEGRMRLKTVISTAAERIARR